MAASGTGLPTIAPAAVTPDVQVRANPGAGLMADQLQGLGREVERLDNTAGALIKQHQDAVEAMHLANQKSYLDDQSSQLHATFLTNPDGYQQAWAGVRKAVVSNTSSRQARALAEYADHVGGTALNSIRIEHAHDQHQQAGQALNARLDRLQTDIGDAVQNSGGGLAALDMPLNKAKVDEYSGIFDQMVSGGFLDPATAAAKREDGLDALKAGAISGHAATVYQAQGIDAALGEIQAIAKDQTIAPHLRDLAVAKATATVNQLHGVDQQRINAAKSADDDARQTMNRLIDDDVGSVYIGGQGTGLTEDKVRATLGSAGVAEWYRKRGAAQHDHNELGDLSGLTPDQAAAKVAAYTGRSDVGSIPTTIGSDKDVDVIVDAVGIAESSGGTNPAARVLHDGNGVPGRGDIAGKYQMSVATARRYDPGVTAQRLLHDDAYARDLAGKHMRFLLNRYNGDAFLATMAYHAGEGNVDKWIKPPSQGGFGDPRAGVDRQAWLGSVRAAGNPRSADYAASIGKAMNGAKAAVAWSKAQDDRLADPAGAVADDFAVQSARNQLTQEAQAGKVKSGTNFKLVATYYQAQERAGIKKRYQQPLPNEGLDVIADRIRGFQTTGDLEGYARYSQALFRQYLDPSNPKSQGYGQRVLSAALVRAGSSEFAARVGSELASTPGLRHADQPAQIAAAARVDHATRATSGGARTIGDLSNDEVMRAAGLK